MLGLRFCTRAFSSCGKRGPLFIAVRGPLTIVASLVAEHKLQTRRFSSCGSRARSLRGMWDLPRPGLEPASPALAGRFPTTAPPGKPRNSNFEIKYNRQENVLSGSVSPALPLELELKEEDWNVLTDMAPCLLQLSIVLKADIPKGVTS